jgi:hypothetical protein
MIRPRRTNDDRHRLDADLLDESHRLYVSAELGYLLQPENLEVPL